MSLHPLLTTLSDMRNDRQVSPRVDFSAPTGRRSIRRVPSMKPPMSAKDQLTLSPWEKFVHYRRFPSKLVLHAILVGTILAQTLFYARSVIPYFLRTEMAFRAEFFRYQNAAGDWVEADGGDGSGQWSVKIVTIDDFKAVVRHVNDEYDHFGGQAIDQYRLALNYISERSASYPCSSCSCNEHFCAVWPATGPLGVHVHVEWSDSSATAPCGTDFLMPLNASSAVWPGFDVGHGSSFFNMTQSTLVKFFDMVDTVTLTWALRDEDVLFLHSLHSQENAVDWVLQANFAVGNGGQMLVAYSARTNFPPDNSQSLLERMLDWKMWRTVWVVQAGVAGLSLMLNAKAVRRHYLTLRSLRSTSDTQATGQAWLELKLEGRKTKSMRWIAFGIAQNIANIWSALQMALPDNLVNNYSETDWVFSVAIFLTLFNSTQYLEFFPKYYVLISTVGEGLPSVLRFIVGCMPLYIAYTALGTILFGRYCELFGSIGMSAITLFSVLNGDSMLDVFNCIYTTQYGSLMATTSQIYLFLFVCVYIYCAISVFITIMSDAFSRVHISAAAKRRDRKELAVLPSTADEQESMRESIYDDMVCLSNFSSSRRLAEHRQTAVFDHPPIDIQEPDLSAAAAGPFFGEKSNSPTSDSGPLALLTLQRQALSRTRAVVATALAQLDSELAALDDRVSMVQQQQQQQQQQQKQQHVDLASPTNDPAPSLSLLPDRTSENAASNIAGEMGYEIELQDMKTNGNDTISIYNSL